MKKGLLLVGLLLLVSAAYAQQDEKLWQVYKLRKQKALQGTIYLENAVEHILLKKGWTLTEGKGNYAIEHTVTKDTVIILPKYAPVEVTGDWEIGEVKHSDDEPEKLYINLNHFPQKKNAYLNNKGYIYIPDNSSVRLIKYGAKLQAITIPFAYRFAINDTIGSKVTTDLKVGASVSYNINWETFKNRRIKAKKSVVGISGGLAFGLSRVVLDASSTSLLEQPYRYQEDGLALFVAPGIGLNLKGFQINISYGWDIPITDNVKDWNYAYRGYLGIGLGVGLQTLGSL